MEILTKKMYEDTECKPLVFMELKVFGREIIAYNQVLIYPTIIRPSAPYGERCIESGTNIYRKCNSK